MARDTQYTLYKTARTDPTFKNIWAFESETQRDLWLNTCSPQPFLNNKYWRVGNSIKCPVRYEESFNYDYVRIVNRSSDNKIQTWFCFIVGRLYISNNCTLFNLAVDYVQTFYWSKSSDGGTFPFWQTDGFLVKSTRDILPPRGTVSEFPVPESTCSYFEWGNTGYSVLIYSTIDLENLNTLSYRSAVIDGQYIACPPYLMGISSSNELSALSRLIADINSKGYTDAISGIYLVPNDYLNIESIPTTPTAITDDSLTELFSPIDVTIPKPTSCDGYVPTNKVLLGFDYSYFTINNGQGEISTWHFEDFDGEPNFKARLSVSSGSPVLILWPNNYINVNQNCSRQMAIKVTQAPACSYLNDSYKIWLAQTQNSRAAAINGAELAISQAKEARDRALSSNIDRAAISAYEWYAGQKSTQKAESEFSNAGWNKKLQNALAGIRDTLITAVGGTTATINPQGEFIFPYSERSQKIGNYYNDTITSVASNVPPETPNVPDWVSTIGQAFVRNAIGIEQAYVYDHNVASAQQRLNEIMASYRDKSRIPATAVGSNAYGDMCVLQQYGFMIAVYTPTRFYAEWIDKELNAGGHTVNTYGEIRKEHAVFDYYLAPSTFIESERDGRPQYARNMLISLLSQGVYLWYVYQGDISDKIGVPYGIDNPEIA